MGLASDRTVYSSKRNRPLLLYGRLLDDSRPSHGLTATNPDYFLFATIRELTENVQRFPAGDHLILVNFLTTQPLVLCRIEFTRNFYGRESWGLRDATPDDTR